MDSALYSFGDLVAREEVRGKVSRAGVVLGSDVGVDTAVGRNGGELVGLSTNFIRELRHHCIYAIISPTRKLLSPFSFILIFHLSHPFST